MKHTIQISETRLNEIIAENLKKIISEGDLLPNGMKSSPAKTAWESITNALDNIKEMMTYTYEGKKGNIGVADAQNALGYIKHTINNCLSVSLPKLIIK